uniref:MFS transporter n=1 Tax=Caldiarchaeum subterraneum TaxID=311458 RepID=A0A7J3VTW6_CALS0
MTPREDKHQSDRIVNSLSATGFFISAQQQMVNPVIGIYANETLHVSPALVGYIFTFFSLSSLATKLSSFFIMSRKKVVNPLFVSGLLISVLAPVGYVAVDDYTVLLLLRIIHGAAFAYDTVLMLTIAGLNSDRNNLLRAIQRYTTFLAVGLTVGPIVGTVLVLLLGVRDTILASSLMGLGAFLTGLRAAGLALKEPAQDYSGTSAKALVKQLKDRVLASTSLAYLSYNIAYGGVLAFSPLIARREVGLSESMVTVMFFLYYVSALSARSTMSTLISRVKVQRVYVAILLVSAVGAFFIAASRNSFVFASGYVLMAVAHGLSFPLSSLIIARRFENSSLRLTANSVLMSMWDTGMMLGPVICSASLVFVALDHVLLPMAVFPLAGCLLMITASLDRSN